MKLVLVAFSSRPCRPRECNVYHSMNKLIIKKQYSPEPRDIYLTVPNCISLLRIVSIPFIAVFVSHHKMVLALIVLALSAVSDGLDGLIARSFNQVSKIGQILDPIADRLLIFCSILALGVANIIPWWMLIVVGLRDLIMAALVLILAQHDYGPLPVDFRRYVFPFCYGYIAFMRPCHWYMGRWLILARRIYLHSSRNSTVEE